MASIKKIENLLLQTMREYKSYIIKYNKELKDTPLILEDVKAKRDVYSKVLRDLVKILKSSNS